MPCLHDTVLISSDWFHIEFVLCLRETVFISYRTDLTFTRERTIPPGFMPFSHVNIAPIRFEMKTVSCKQKKLRIGLPFPMWYEMKVVSYKRGPNVRTVSGFTMAVVFSATRAFDAAQKYQGHFKSQCFPSKLIT